MDVYHHFRARWTFDPTILVFAAAMLATTAGAALLAMPTPAGPGGGGGATIPSGAYGDPNSAWTLGKLLAIVAVDIVAILAIVWLAKYVPDWAKEGVKAAGVVFVVGAIIWVPTSQSAGLGALVLLLVSLWFGVWAAMKEAKVAWLAWNLAVVAGCAVIGALVGKSLSVPLLAALLVILSVTDVVGVSVIGYIKTLAKASIDAGIPPGLVVPKGWPGRWRLELDELEMFGEGESKAALLGTGDLMLGAAAAASVAANLPVGVVGGVVFGATVGVVAISGLSVGDDDAYPALPPITAGCAVGFIASYGVFALA